MSVETFNYIMRVLKFIRWCHEKAWGCKFYDWKDYVGSWFLLSGFLIAPTIIIGWECMKAWNNYWGFLIWPANLIFWGMLAKGMADNMDR